MSRSRCNVLICTGGGCVASGALELSAAMRAAIEKHGLEGEVQVFETGCLGPCAAGPVAVVYPDGILYQNLKPADAERIAEEHLLKGRIVEGPRPTSRGLRAWKRRACRRSPSSASR